MQSGASNVANAASNAQSDVGLYLRPSLRFESNWVRHSWEGQASGDFMAYLENGRATTIAEAIALEADAPEASPFAKKSGAFLTFLRAKATARERADLMRQLNDEYLPDGRPRAKAGAAK